MGQTQEGAKRAAETAKRLYGEDHHRRVGKLGGKSSHKGGFATLSPAERREISSQGGKAKKGYRKHSR